MRIPLDFFLRLIEKFLNEHDMEKVVKKLRKYLETPEEDFSDILSELSLQEIISKYVKENKELKKKIKSKIKKYMEEHKQDEEEAEKEIKEEKEEKLTNKKRKRTLSNVNEEENEQKPEKKRKRTMSNAKEEQKEENQENKKSKKNKKTEENTDNEKEEENKMKMDEEEEKPKKIKNKDKKKKEEDDIDLEKEVKFIPKPKSDNNPDRVPFKRIDDSKLKHEVPEKYRDNSYAAYLKQTGDDFGKAANDKLIVTRGKGFRKEKSKFKNKTFHGGMTISTTVRSIPLEDDDSSDD